MKKKRSFLEEAMNQAYERGYSRGLSFRADETYDDGFSDGILQERSRIIKALDEADSACSGWAIAIVKGEK